MSTAVATRPATSTKGISIVHKITWGKSTFVCIHPYCDGTHHVYVSCAH